LNIRIKYSQTEMVLNCQSISIMDLAFSVRSQTF